MTLKQYLLVMGCGTAISWTAAAIIIFGIDPNDTQAVVFGALYASLLLGLTGLLSIIGFSLRVWLLPKDFLLSRQVLISFRQAVLVSLLLVILLVLKSRSLLSWFNAILVVVGLTLVESFFLSARKRH